jgi:hypothetical protein
LFFQYGELKNKKKFKSKIRSLFVIYSKKLIYIRGDLIEYTYDPQSFKDRILKLDETIYNILEEQDPTKQIVNVEEQGTRIIITQKIVSTNLHFKIVEKGIKEFSKEYLEDEALVAWYELLNKLYEMYLEGLLGNNFKKGTELISEKFRELSESEESSAAQKRSTRSEIEVYDLYSKFNRALNSSDSKSKAFNCQPSDHELSDKEKIKLKNQARDLAFRKIVFGDVPEYFYELVFKVRSKIIWNISKGLTDDYDLYSEYSVKDIKIMCELKRMLKEYLQNSTKIFLNHKLSEESISNLVRICLELIL